jgi:hypothetical protein
VSAWRERHGLARDALTYELDALPRRLSAGRPAEPTALLAHAHAHAPRFLGAFDDPAATVAALRARCPGDEAEVLARAERVLAGRFDLMGHRGLSYGDPIDWQCDPLAGTRAPMVTGAAFPTSTRRGWATTRWCGS